MLKFIKRGKKYIYSLDEQRYVTGQYLRDLIKNNVPIQYTDNTGKDLIAGLKKGVRKNQKPKEEEFLGPDTPLNEPKMYECGRCKVKNINRFNCTRCIELISDRNIDGDNIYYVW